MDGRSRWMNNVFKTGSELRIGLTRWRGCYNVDRAHSKRADKTPDATAGGASPASQNSPTGNMIETRDQLNFAAKLSKQPGPPQTASFDAGLCQSYGVQAKMACQANQPGSIVRASRETPRAGKVNSPDGYKKSEVSVPAYVPSPRAICFFNQACAGCIHS